MLICPSSCYTMRYKTNADQYPIYGNETYSGVTFLTYLVKETNIFVGRIHWCVNQQCMMEELLHGMKKILLS